MSAAEHNSAVVACSPMFCSGPTTTPNTVDYYLCELKLVSVIKLIRIRYTLTSLSNMTESVSVGIRDPATETVINANRETVIKLGPTQPRTVGFVMSA